MTIINVVNGMIGPLSVNFDETIDIGTRQMEEFKRKLPDGFYSIPMKVKTMAVTRKSEVISSELSPVPTALFNDTGEMRISKSKSELKTLTKVEVSARHPTPEATSTVIDGCPLLWIPQCPSKQKNN